MVCEVATHQNFILDMHGGYPIHKMFLLKTIFLEKSSKLQNSIPENFWTVYINNGDNLGCFLFMYIFSFIVIIFRV